MDLETQLAVIGEQVRADLAERNAARDRAINLAREQIRHCSLAVRATHRNDYPLAQEHLAAARRTAAEIAALSQPFADLYASGYVQDAMKELAEAHITFAIITQQDIPTPQALSVESAAWLNGLAESVGELRRKLLDLLREGYNQESERLMQAMDTIYDLLVTIDFPESLTGGLRRNTDLARGIVERTRGDLTFSVREAALRRAIEQLASALNAPTYRT